MNILIINDFESGGGAEGVFQMTLELLSRDFNVYTYTAYKGFKDSGANPLAYIYSKKHFNKVKQIVLEKDIDIVHIQNFRWLTPSIFSVKRWLRKNHTKNVSFVLTAHDYFLVCPNVAYGFYRKNEFLPFSPTSTSNSFLTKQMDQHGWKFSWLKKIQWYLAFSILGLQREIDYIISPSHFLENVIHLHYPKIPISLVRNPISLDFKKSTNMDSDSKNTFKKFIYMGRVASEKGTDQLLTMLSKIKKDVDFELDIYGTGPMADKIPQMIDSLGLSKQVYFWGYVPFSSILEKITQYHSFIMSSIWYENAPLSIVEASLNGLNVIVPDMGGMKELAQLCTNDFEYSLGDSQSLLSAMKKSIEHTYDDKEMENLKTIFSQKQYLENIKTIYENTSHR